MGRSQGVKTEKRPVKLPVQKSLRPNDAEILVAIARVMRRRRRLLRTVKGQGLGDPQRRKKVPEETLLQTPLTAVRRMREVQRRKGLDRARLAVILRMKSQRRRNLGRKGKQPGLKTKDLKSLRSDPKKESSSEDSSSDSD